MTSPVLSPMPQKTLHLSELFLRRMKKVNTSLPKTPKKKAKIIVTLTMTPRTGNILEKNGSNILFWKDLSFSLEESGHIKLVLLTPKLNTVLSSSSRQYNNFE